MRVARPKSSMTDNTCLELTPDPHRHISRKQFKSTSYDRLSTVAKISSSYVQAEDVDLLFKPEFLNCPGKANEVGDKIQGSSVDEILEKIINQLRPIGFSIKSAEEFNRIYQETFPCANNLKIQETIGFLRLVFRDLEIDDKHNRTPAELSDAFEQAKTNLKKYTYECLSSSKIPVSIRNDLEELLGELSGSGQSNFTCPHRSSFYKAMSSYWHQLLRGIMIEDMQADTEPTGHNADNVAVKSIRFKENGKCHHQFEMEITDDFLLGMCEDVDKQNVHIGPKGDADTSDSGSECKRTSWKTIVAQPGLTGFVQIDQQEEEVTTLFLVAQFKGTLHTTIQERAGSESCESRASTCVMPVSDPKLQPVISHRCKLKSVDHVINKRKYVGLEECQNKRIRSSMDLCEDEIVHTSGMCTEHFLELLCGIKFQNSGDRFSNTIDKCFGLYCVRHKVYITCLAAVRKTGNEALMMKNLNAAPVMFMKYSETPQAFRDNKEIKLRMVFTDYLDMTNPVHMEAILKFIAVLGTYET